MEDGWVMRDVMAKSKTRFVPTEDRIQITFNFGQHPFLSSTHDHKD